ncbi:hypothetical protein KP509_30G053000 [Ceratopteris richardii]|nr:hypothetical protein KP509_30G053000 [Ceratopteris richardii]
MREFGLDLGELRSDMLSHIDDQNNAYKRFCMHLRRTENASRRLELAKDFLSELASTEKTTMAQATRTLVNTQNFCLNKLQLEKQNAEKITFELKNEVEKLKRDLQRAESRYEMLEKQLRLKWEEDKASLEENVREELEACCICRKNTRNSIILPCRHAQFCGECLETHRKKSNFCPICRKAIEGTSSYIF